MARSDLLGIREFLRDFPGMSIAPMRGQETVLRGILEFEASPKQGVVVTDSYHLEITIPGNFPKEIPRIIEIGSPLGFKIPRDGHHHVNPDNTLCLGSPVRLLQKLSKLPTLPGFSSTCLIPYLYAISYKQRYGGQFIFDELAHGKEGILADYLELFRLRDVEQVVRALELVGMKRRIANKRPCPCACGKRLGVCSFRNKINELRELASRSWFKGHARMLRGS